jgi:hypothetical protein
MVSSRRLERATPNEQPTACGWRRLVALLCFAPCATMADQFDIVTFDAPPAWERQATADGLVFNVRSAGAESCQVRLSKSRKLVATLAEELEHTWSALVARQTLVGEASAPRQLDLGNGLTLAQRFAQVRASDSSYITMLNLFQRDDRLVTVTVIADPKAFEHCNAAIGEFLAGLRLDKTVMPQPPSPQVKSDPPWAARFGNSVVGTWRFALTAATSTLNAPTQVRNVIEIRFARDGTYNITYAVAVPGSSNFAESETGTYRSEGQRLLMRPKQTDGSPSPYTLDWFFGDHPDYRGNWGLILRSNANWLGGDKDYWRTFKPAQ